MNPIAYTNTVHVPRSSTQTQRKRLLRVMGVLALASAIFYAGWSAGLSVGALRAENDMRDPATDSGGVR